MECAPVWSAPTNTWPSPSAARSANAPRTYWRVSLPQRAAAAARSAVGSDGASARSRALASAAVLKISPARSAPIAFEGAVPAASFVVTTRAAGPSACASCSRRPWSQPAGSNAPASPSGETPARSSNLNQPSVVGVERRQERDSLALDPGVGCELRRRRHSDDDRRWDASTGEHGGEDERPHETP